MDISILEDLGLTQAETKVYLALLELGSSTAGPILEKSGLQNSVVHRALNSLIAKGLINFVSEGKRKIYQATNPEKIIEATDKTKAVIEINFEARSDRSDALDCNSVWPRVTCGYNRRTLFS